MGIETRKELDMSYQPKVADELMKSIHAVVKRNGSGGWLKGSDREFYVSEHVLSLLSELFVFVNNPEAKP